VILEDLVEELVEQVVLETLLEEQGIFPQHHHHKEVMVA